MEVGRCGTRREGREKMGVGRRGKRREGREKVKGAGEGKRVLALAALYQ